MKFDPMGSELCVVPVRGCATLTRGYKKCDPYGVGSLAALPDTDHHTIYIPLHGRIPPVVDARMASLL